MTDKELLERAAMAAGMEVGFESGQWFWCEHGPRGAGMYAGSGYTHWNPLTDDGDALRLAARLNLWGAIRLAHREVTDTMDIYAATRRAITRAAAAMAQKGE